MSALFRLGQIVATPGALAALERVKQTPTRFLACHAIGDWGELEPTDVAENEYSVVHGFRLRSSYKTDAGEKQTGRQRLCSCQRSTDELLEIGSLVSQQSFRAHLIRVQAVARCRVS